MAKTKKALLHEICKTTWHHSKKKNELKMPHCLPKGLVI